MIYKNKFMYKDLPNSEALRSSKFQSLLKSGIIAEQIIIRYL